MATERKDRFGDSPKVPPKPDIQPNRGPEPGEKHEPNPQQEQENEPKPQGSDFITDPKPIPEVGRIQQS